MNDFADRVREARERRGISQTQLCRLSEVDPATIYRIETGKSRGHASTAQKLAQALGVSAQWLLTGQGRMDASDGHEPLRTFPDPAQTQSPGMIPAQLYALVAARGREICPVTPAETAALTRAALAQRLDADKLEVQLYMLRAAESDNAPEVMAAFQAMLARREQERKAHGKPQAAPNSVKKARKL